MKFGKELASQMVQEWQEAYMDYNCLKEVLKDLMKYRQQHGVSSSSSPSAAAPSRSLKMRQTMYRAFSCLTGRLNNSPKQNHDDQVILANAVEEEEGSETWYQTMFLRSSEEGSEKDLVFFKRLDDEFNKVLKFYWEKVEEVKSKAEELNKQIHALIALRIRVDKPNVGQQFDHESKAASNSGTSSPANIPASVNQGVPRMEVIGEIE